MRFQESLRVKRPASLFVSGRALRLPVFFPSVSSVKTNLRPIEYFRILCALQQPQFLLSAYDIARAKEHEAFSKLVAECRTDDGPVILLDSGNYESYWLRDVGWKIDDFNEVLQLELADLAFCFDNQSPPADVQVNAEQVVYSSSLSQSVTSGTTLVPILHGETGNLVELVLEVVRKSGHDFLALPERILGDGIVERVRTITRIREQLLDCEDYVHIHLLGTGNPLSLILLAFAGADSFDGLEWCQTTVDPTTLHLYHFQQRDLVKDDCEFCADEDLDYVLRTLGHNLRFFRNLMASIQESLREGREIELLSKHFKPQIIEELVGIWQ